MAYEYQHSVHPQAAAVVVATAARGWSNTKRRPQEVFAVLCCVFVRRLRLGASGVVAAARGVVIPLKHPHTAATPTIAHRTSQTTHRQVTTHGWPPATHRRIFVFSEKMWKIMDMIREKKWQTPDGEASGFAQATSNGQFPQSAQTNLYDTS